MNGRGQVYGLAFRYHEQWHDDGVLADQVRSHLGPLVKMLDQPHPHVVATGGIVTLHGDVSDLTARAAIEAAVRDVPGVRAVHSHLHVGLLPGDTVPSAGRRDNRSPLLLQLESVARDTGLFPQRQARYALRAVLAVLAARLPVRERRRFLQHVPQDVRVWAKPAHWFGDDLGSLKREHDFAQSVALMAGLSRDRADLLIRRVLPLLRQHAPCDADAIARVLPAELRAIWTAQPEPADS